MAVKKLRVDPNFNFLGPFKIANCDLKEWEEYLKYLSYAFTE